MMKDTRTGLFLAVLLSMFCAFAALPGLAVAEEDEKKPFFLSPTASWYLPTDGGTKDAFGSTWHGFGAAINMEAFGWESPGFNFCGIQLSPYVGYLHAEKRDNEAHVVPIGLQTHWSLTRQGALRPYVGLGAGVSAVKFEDEDAGVETGWRGAFGSRLSVGVDVGKWLNVQASYNLMSEVKDYDFSGFSISAKLTFYF